MKRRSFVCSSRKPSRRTIRYRRWNLALKEGERAGLGGSSDRRPPHRQLADPHVALAGADRDALAVLAAEAGLHVEVVGDGVDRSQCVDAVADQSRAAARLRDLARLD